MMKRKMKENENSMDDVKAAFKVFDQDGDGQGEEFCFQKQIYAGYAAPK